jgi:dimethylamine corrinoid protein
MIWRKVGSALMVTALTQALGDLDEAAVEAGVKQKLEAGVPALEILEELQQGMTIVGNRYESCDYYLSELVLAAEIFKNSTGQLGTLLEQSATETLGTIVLGTVFHDIHDFGKDIVGMVLRSNGFKVVDLGVNVPYETFIDAIKANDAQLVGLSCLLTTVFDDMKATVEAIAAAGLRDKVKILIGGGPVDQAVCDYVKADAYCFDAQQAVEAAKKMVGVD